MPLAPHEISGPKDAKDVCRKVFLRIKSFFCNNNLTVGPYLEVPNPDALAAELASRSVRFSVSLWDDDDGLRGFVIEDIDGYCLFFGHRRG